MIFFGIGKRVNDDDDKKPTVRKSNADEKSEPQPEEIFVLVEPKFDFDDIILPERVREQIMNAADYAENSKVVFED